MDTIGLLAAWVEVLSFLGGILVAMTVSFAGRRVRQWWAATSQARAEMRIRELTSDLKGVACHQDTNLVLAVPRGPHGVIFLCRYLSRDPG